VNTCSREFTGFRDVNASSTLAGNPCLRSHAFIAQNLRQPLSGSFFDNHRLVDFANDSEEDKMSTTTNSPSHSRLRLSLDAWAVLIALAAAVLIRVGVIPKVPW